MKLVTPMIAAILLLAWIDGIAADVTGSFFAVVVDDIDTSETWYRETLGLAAGERLREDGRYEIVNLRKPGLFVELLELADANDRPDGYAKGPFKAGMLVDDIHVFLAGLPDSVVVPDIIEDETNGLLILQLNDPDGNIVQVMQAVD